jgi:long-subunit fatty acid transport protein
VAAAVLPATPAPAQTNDRAFRSWRWPQESTAARPAGWAGLAVAVADDPLAADVNPALLGTLSKGEVFGNASAFDSGRTPVGDEASSRRALGLTGVAVRVSSRLTLGLTAAQPRVVRFELAPVRLADGSTDAGALDVRALDLALGAAWRLRPHLQVGVRVLSSRLSLSAATRHEPAVGPIELRVTSDASATRVSAGVGVVYAPSSKLTLGFASQAGIAYPATRRAESPLLGVVLDPGSGYELRRPSSFAAGAHLRLSPRFAVGGQVDYVRWSEIPAGLVIAVGARSRDEYRLGDALEPRLGAEYSLALKRASLQVRAGLHAQSPGTLRFEGDDAAERSAFPGADWVISGAMGVSVVTTRLHVDVAGSFGGERPRFLAGAGVRF